MEDLESGTFLLEDLANWELIEISFKGEGGGRGASKDKVLIISSNANFFFVSAVRVVNGAGRKSATQGIPQY